MEDFHVPKAQEIGENFALQSQFWKDDYKFLKMLDDHSFINNEYDRIFEIETTESYRRLKIAADSNQIDLMLQLCENLEPPYFILYVLVVSRNGHEQGRYQSDRIDSIYEVRSFLKEYKTFFETDGKHHIWVGTVNNSGLLIYDQHNVIFSYGKLEEQVITLQKDGFEEMSFSFPTPHAHSFNASNDKFEEKILQHWDWEIFPLTEDDTYEN